MKPLSLIYGIRACLGPVAAALCVVLGINSLVSGLMLVLAIYLLTNYFLRQLFIRKVRKASKVLTTGMAAYFLTWVITWTVLYTILHPTG